MALDVSDPELVEKLKLLAEKKLAPIEQGSVAYANRDDEDVDSVNDQMDKVNKRISAYTSADTISAFFGTSLIQTTKNPAFPTDQPDHSDDRKPEPWSRPGSSYITAQSSLPDSRPGSGFVSARNSKSGSIILPARSSDSDKGFGPSRSGSTISLPGVASNGSINGDQTAPVRDPQQETETQKTFWQRPFREKMKHIGILALYAVTAIDLRPSDQPKTGEKILSTKEKILTNFISVVVAIGSGFTTGVAIAGMPIPKFLEYLLGLTTRTAPWLIGLAGYRVNMGVYKGAIEYTYKSLVHEGALNEWRTKNPKTGESFIDKETGTPIPGKWVGMSRKKSVGVIVGMVMTYLGSLALSIFTFVSMHKGLIAIFTAVHVASVVCPPLALTLAGIVAAISFFAIFSLMYKSMHTAIRENAFDSFIKFVKGLVPPSEYTNQQKIKHYIVSVFKVLFIIAGISLALVATIATLGAWSKSLVDAITLLDTGWAKFANVFSPIAVWGFTAAGRFPMVLEKAANVFSSMGEWTGRFINWCAEKVHIFTPDPTEQTSAKISIWRTIKNECIDEKTQKWSPINTLIFAGKCLAIGISMTAVAYYCLATIFDNAGGNGAVADEGGSVLGKILGWFNIHPSPAVEQNTLPLIAGGSVSAILGLDAAKTNYLKDVEMTEIPSNKKTNNASLDTTSTQATQSDQGHKYQSFGVKTPSTYMTNLFHDAGNQFQKVKNCVSSILPSSPSSNNNNNRGCDLLSWRTSWGTVQKDKRPLVRPNQRNPAADHVNDKSISRNKYE